MKRGTVARPSQMNALYWRWALTLLTFGGFLWAMNAILAGSWNASIRLGWTLASGAFCAYVLSILWKALPFNYRIEDGVFFSHFGTGNLVSLLRGWFLAALAGFLFIPSPTGWSAWLPGILYILNGIADLFDGYFARLSRQVTVMGERLDISLDGFGVLFASLLLYRYGTLPSWILFVGTARYLFLFVAKLREQFGKPVYELPPSTLRRALAGVQMGYLGAVLLPVFDPPATNWVGAFFSFPFLINFGHDLLWMCGIRLNRIAFQWLPLPLGRLVTLGKRWLLDWLPLGLRLLTGFAISKQLWDWFHSPPILLSVWTPLGSDQTQFRLMLVFYAIGLISLVVGFVGRGGAVLLLIGVGLQQGILPLGWPVIGILVAACVLLFLGSGSAAIWKPEERLIRHRWGEG